MKKLWLFLLLVGCGTHEAPLINITLTPPTERVLVESLERYRRLCRKYNKSPLCDRPVVIEFTDSLPDDIEGVCTATWFGTKMTRQIQIQSYVRDWGRDQRDTLMAHEAEHCLRGINHSNGGETLMNPYALPVDVIEMIGYEALVRVSLRTPDGSGYTLASNETEKEQNDPL
jgi:hypothetical protein